MIDKTTGLSILFIAGFGPITRDSAARKTQGYHLLVDNRQEPWGQTVTRLLSPEGLLVGLTITPWLREV